MSRVASPPALNLNTLNFDTCERLRHLESLFQAFALPDGALILDAGGYPCYMARAFPQWNIVTADIYANGHPPYVKASGAALPFADNTFEVAVACDVLEHVPAAYREAFLTELGRVARQAVIVAGPYTTPGAEQAEDVVRSMLPASSPAQAWLAEHKQCGLPTLAETMAVFAGEAIGIKVFPVGTLSSWMLFFAGQAAAERSHDQAQIFQAFIEVHNALGTALDTTAKGPAYRHAVVAAFTPACWNALAELPGDVTDHAHECALVEDYVARLGAMLSGIVAPTDVSPGASGTLDAEYVARLEKMLAHRQPSNAAPASASSDKKSLPTRLKAALRILAGR